MNKILLFILLSIPLFSQAQQDDKKKERTVTIIGTSRVTVTPDVGILNIQVSQIDLNFNKAITKMADKTNYYVKILTGLGFKEEEIKTTNFSVTQNKIYRRDEMIDSGYIASQRIKVEFSNDKKILTKILNKLAGGETEIDYSFDFKLSEKLKAETQNKGIELAIKDAKSKADVIIIASQIKLKELKSISYGTTFYGGIPPATRAFDLYKAAGAGADKSFNFTPDDQEFQDSVTMEWIIE